MKKIGNDMRKVSLDSNTYTNYVKGQKSITEILESSDVVYMSTVVLGELYAAFKKGNKEKENLRNLGKFLSKKTVEIINITEETSKIYGEIKNNLERKGKPISVNDVWIAANTIETGSELLTYDSDFLEVKGLRIWNYLKEKYS